MRLLQIGKERGGQGLVGMPSRQIRRVGLQLQVRVDERSTMTSVVADGQSYRTGKSRNCEAATR
jgi:hypothetical protein